MLVCLFWFLLPASWSSVTWCRQWVIFFFLQDQNACSVKISFVSAKQPHPKPWITGQALAKHRATKGTPPPPLYKPRPCPCHRLFLSLGSLVQATVGVGTVLIWYFAVAYTRGGGGVPQRMVGMLVLMWAKLVGEVYPPFPPISPLFFPPFPRSPPVFPRCPLLSPVSLRFSSNLASQIFLACTYRPRQWINPSFIWPISEIYSGRPRISYLVCCSKPGAARAAARAHRPHWPSDRHLDSAGRGRLGRKVCQACFWRGHVPFVRSVPRP